MRNTVIFAVLLFIAVAVLIISPYWGLQVQENARPDSLAGAQICEGGKILRSGTDCWEPWETPACGTEGDLGCCAPEQCLEEGRCYGTEDALQRWPYYLCHEGLWDWCGAEDICEIRGDYFCNGTEWIKGTKEDCISARKKCPEGEFFRDGWACWEDKDSIECGTATLNFGCCGKGNECWDNGRCYASEVLEEGYEMVLCYNGKWDFCTPDDVCVERGNFYCDGMEWKRGNAPESCRLRGYGTWDSNNQCPNGGFYRGEWDCYEPGDDEMCGTADAEHGCCAGDDCWFSGACHAAGTPLSESSEWLCTAGMWDKCTQADECENRGQYRCSGGIWEGLKSGGCEGYTVK